MMADSSVSAVMLVAANVASSHVFHKDEEQAGGLASSLVSTSTRPDIFIFKPTDKDSSDFT